MHREGYKTQLEAGRQVGPGVETSPDSWGPTSISSTFLDFSPDSCLLTLDVSEGMQNILGGFVH